MGPLLGGLVGGLGQAVPSLFGSLFMGKDQKNKLKAEAEANKAQAGYTRSQTLSNDQLNMYREWMRPQVQQAMMGMMGRLPAHLQGGMPQNFPNFQSSIDPAKGGVGNFGIPGGGPQAMWQQPGQQPGAPGMAQPRPPDQSRGWSGLRPPSMAQPVQQYLPRF